LSSETAPVRGALFLDRDGTLITDEHYLADENRVRLLPGAARAVALANSAAVPVVVVTNQSGIGRGLFSDAQYHAVASEMTAQLAQFGARIDATYYCPHAPGSALACECRKPALGMYQQAASDHHLSLAQSAYIGDKWRDVSPALVTGGLGILVPASTTPSTDVDRAVLSAHTASDVEQAVVQALAWMRARR
jgi:D-glycero-D-manno-heptose 1,7-bisphosphate phosphatase